MKKSAKGQQRQTTRDLTVQALRTSDRGKVRNRGHRQTKQQQAERQEPQQQQKKSKKRQMKKRQNNRARSGHVTCAEAEHRENITAAAVRRQEEAANEARVRRHRMAADQRKRTTACKPTMRTSVLVHYEFI